MAPGHRRPLFAIVGASLLLGCGHERLAPFAVGQAWDYRVRFGVEREMARISVTRQAPIAGGMGWELAGPMGVARVGYAGDRLVADQLGGAFLTPPIPVGVPLKDRVLWHGTVDSIRGRQPGSATIVATEGKLKVQGRDRTLNRTDVTLRVGGHTIELSTWYAPGEGILQQEQLTDEKLNLTLERVGGG